MIMAYLAAEACFHTCLHSHRVLIFCCKRLIISGDWRLGRRRVVIQHPGTMRNQLPHPHINRIVVLGPGLDIPA